VLQGYSRDVVAADNTNAIVTKHRFLQHNLNGAATSIWNGVQQLIRRAHGLAEQLGEPLIGHGAIIEIGQVPRSLATATILSTDVDRSIAGAGNAEREAGTPEAVAS
jgi:hypothetical protein